MRNFESDNTRTDELRLTIAQSDGELKSQFQKDSVDETLPLLSPHVRVMREIPFTERPLIKKLKAIYQTEKYIFLSFSLGNAIVTVGEGFPANLITIIKWAKWIAIANASVGAGIGIHKMNYPDTEFCFTKPFVSIMQGVSAATFSLQAILAIILLDFINQPQVDITNLEFLAICLTPLIIGIGTTLSLITDYKAEPLISTNNIAKFFSFLGLQVANTGSTLQTTLHYIFDLLRSSATNYTQLSARYFAAGVAALMIELTRISDTFTDQHRFYKYLQYLQINRLPRKFISESLDLASMFNYAVFWTSLYIQTSPTKKYPSVDVATFDIQASLLLFIVMSPVLAALVGDSLYTFIKSIPKLIEDYQNNISESSDESEEELQLPYGTDHRDDYALTINEGPMERIQPDSEESDNAQTKDKPQSKQQHLDVVALTSNNSREINSTASSVPQGYYSDTSIDSRNSSKIANPVITRNRHSFFPSSPVIQKVTDDDIELPETPSEKEETNEGQRILLSRFMANPIPRKFSLPTSTTVDSNVSAPRNPSLHLPLNTRSARKTPPSLPVNANEISSYSKNYASA